LLLLLLLLHAGCVGHAADRQAAEAAGGQTAMDLATADQPTGQTVRGTNLKTVNANTACILLC
jgi:hypothetical protein